MSANGNKVFVTWRDDSGKFSANPEISFRASNDGGVSFGPKINLSADSQFSTIPNIASAGNNVYVGWTSSSSNSQSDIILRVSNNNGVSFNGKINLSGNQGLSNRVDIVADGNEVFVVWDDEQITDGPREVLFRKSSDAGLTFSTVDNLSLNAGTSNVPKIAKGSLVVTWRDDSLGNLDVLFVESIDNGGTFGNTLNLSSNAGDSIFQQVVIDGGEKFVVWIDDSSGNFEVLFRTTATNPPVANDDSRDVELNTPIDIAVLTNDDTIFGPPSDVLTIISKTYTR